MFKFSIKIPAISAAEFAALVEIQPNLAPLADAIVVGTADKAVTVSTLLALKRLEKYEYITNTTTVLNEDKDFWVTEFTIYGD